MVLHSSGGSHSARILKSLLPLVNTILILFLNLIINNKIFYYFILEHYYCMQSVQSLGHRLLTCNPEGIPM